MSSPREIMDDSVKPPSESIMGGGKLHMLIRHLLTPGKLQKVAVKAKKNKSTLKIKSSQGFSGLMGKKAPEGDSTPGEGPPV